jgi:deoxycytidylate deaminase
VSLVGAVIFSTYFPSLNDMVLILAVGITTVYFMGNISDTKTVDLINSTKENGISLEMIKLES